MVDLVKIRKKAKEKAESEAPAPQGRHAPETPLPAEPPKPKKTTAERRAPVASEQRAASSEEAASKAPRQPATPVPQKPTAPPPPSTEDRPPSTERPSADVAPPAGRTSARAISKLERYKEQAGKRRESAESIGKTTAATTTEETQLEVLTFVIAGESYAIEIEKIVEIVPPRAATRVPNATESVVGIISLRGTIVTLIDVRRRLKHATAEPTVDTRIIVLEHEGETVGFEVDRVFRVVKIPASEVAPHPVVHASEQDESIRGVFRHGESLTILLDFAKLLGGREATRTGPRAAVASRR